MTIKDNIANLNLLRVNLFLELEGAKTSWFGSKAKIKKIESRIKVLEDSVQSLEQLLNTLTSSEVKFITPQLDFPQAQKITRLGFYLNNRQLKGEEWIHSYKIEQ